LIKKIFLDYIVFLAKRFSDGLKVFSSDFFRRKTGINSIFADGDFDGNFGLGSAPNPVKMTDFGFRLKKQLIIL